MCERERGERVCVIVCVREKDRKREGKMRAKETAIDR